jgi:uncharacterized damage-inducible protein DinB
LTKQIQEFASMDTQPESTLVELIRYNNWANAQVLAACQELTERQLAATAPGTYGSIHKTLGHIIGAEADYVDRMTGDGPQPPFRWEDGPPVAELATFAARRLVAAGDGVGCRKSLRADGAGLCGTTGSP